MELLFIVVLSRCCSGFLVGLSFGPFAVMYVLFHSSLEEKDAQL